MTRRNIVYVNNLRNYDRHCQESLASITWWMSNGPIGGRSSETQTRVIDMIIINVAITQTDKGRNGKYETRSL